MFILYFILTVAILKGIVYLFLIAPSSRKHKFTQDFFKFYYAHRGFHDNESDAPENSLKSFELAVNEGYGMEFDIQLSKDEKVVVFHDDTTDRMCGIKGKVSDFTYEELNKMKLLKSEETIPLFEDMLKVVDGKTPLIIELKGMSEKVSTLCKKTDEILKDYKGIYCIESFNPNVVKWYKENRPEVMRGQLSCHFPREYVKGFKYTALEYLLQNFATKPDFIAYQHKQYNNLSFKICRKLFKSTTVAWTILNQEEFTKAKENFDIYIFEGFKPE